MPWHKPQPSPDKQPAHPAHARTPEPKFDTSIKTACRTPKKRRAPSRDQDRLLSPGSSSYPFWAVSASQHGWRFTRGEQALSIPVRGSFVSNSGQALFSAALNGIGVVVQGDVLLESAIGSGQLVQLLPDWELPARPIHLVRTRS
ncbi:LysR substrate-binding domain-containing protein [Collimonas silvisoli]|uniref:LysR substrate-binding domain-containing protein n=1 Tax=Collimonas silvisoli TaxID=2825884 RepID=UPI001B8CF3DF|nr:LysR substrate-binding domain-containing protein [Collimonas silvisoli]